MEEITNNFERALSQMRKGKIVKNVLRNGKGMKVGMQKVDENSKMTMEYLFMHIVRDGEVDKYVPRFPSNLDLIRGQRIEA